MKVTRFMALLSAVLLAATTALLGQATLTSGNTEIGVFNTGNLGGDGVGINYIGVGDAITPGCLCEGWGLSGNGIAGWAASADGGTVNVSLDSFTSSSTNITSAVHLTSLPELQMTQSYGFSATPGLFADTVTITNTGALPITDVRYSRALDWDVPPTDFNEFISIFGTGTTADLILSNDNGFATPPDPTLAPASPTPLTACAPDNTDFNLCGPADHGSYFAFGFGTLGAGDSLTFTAFFGAEGSRADAVAALGANGAEILDLAQSNTPGGIADGTPATFTFGFKGVGGTPVFPPGPSVPEPASLTLMFSGLGFGVFGRKYLRRK